MSNCNKQCYGCMMESFCANPPGDHSHTRSFGAPTTTWMPSNQAEQNIPFLPDSHIANDDFLRRRDSRPADWRWRLPDLETVKQVNSMINQDINFSSLPTLDSFAAFAEDVTYDLSGNAVSIAPAATTSNIFSDLLSGITKTVLPAATQAGTTYVQQKLGGSTPAPKTAAQQALAKAATAVKSDMTPILLVGALAVGAFFLMRK